MNIKKINKLLETPYYILYWQKKYEYEKLSPGAMYPIDPLGPAKLVELLMLEEL